MSRRLVLHAVLVASLAAAVAAAAIPPSTVNYQGVLRNASDKPLTGTYDMTFRFFDAASGGSEILVDTHAASGSGAVGVTGGMFDALLGGGTVTDGAGAGTYTNLGDVFRDYGAVWVEITVGGETLSPRIKIEGSAYAMNATNLGGRAASGYLDTSATTQTKPGTLLVGAPGKTGIDATGQYPGFFHDTDATSYAYLGQPNIGVQGDAVTIGGAFNERTYGAFTYVAYNGEGVLAYGHASGGHFINGIDLSEARLGASGGYGVYANATYAGGYFADAVGGGSDSTYLANSTYGIRAFGSYMGGYVSNTLGDSYAQLGLNGGYGVLGYGSTSGGYFKDNTSKAYSYVGYNHHGIEGYGDVAGAYFKNSSSGAYSWQGYNGYGVQGFGGSGGGFFTNTVDGAKAYIGIPANGVFAYSPPAGGGMAGYFINNYPHSGSAYVALATDSNSVYGGPFAVKAVADDSYGNWPGDFVGSWSGVFTRVAFNSFSGNYKVYGNGGVSFVQNHPADPSKLIVYTAPEGDETAVYTRGTAKLANGEARVALGDTFKWVANPDIGLTAQVTPRGAWSDLYVASVTTGELVVRARDGAGDGAFDYAVWGLRIGFEDAQVVTKKTHEAMIPNMSRTRQSNADNADLKQETAIERFRRMESEARGLDAARDMPAARALHDAIGEYDASVDSAMRRELTIAPRRPPAIEPDAAAPPAAPAEPVPPPIAPPAVTATAAPVAHETGPAYPQNAALVPVGVTVEAGDVLANDPDRPGEMRLASLAADPGVVGIVGGETGARWSDRAPVVFAGAVVVCRVDASYGSVAPGDLLVASATPGFAMRAGKSPAPGTIVAKALEPLESGQALIRVLAMAR